MVKKLHTLFFSALFFISQGVQAQAMLEVAAKTIEKQLSCNSESTIILNGENATIRIDTWNKDEVKVKLKLITKHRIRTVAVEELDNIKYVIEKKGNTIYLRNYFLSQNKSATGCILKVEYELTVPARSNFSIKNNLGDVEVKNTEGKLDIEAKFGDINLSNTKGTIGINLSLGDIQADQVDGTITIQATHSELRMEKLSGKYYLKLVSSDLSFRPANRVELLDIETKNGDVNLFFNPGDNYNYTFNTSYGEIRVPDIFKSKVTKEQNKSSFKYSINHPGPSVFISSDFGNITLTNNFIIK